MENKGLEPLTPCVQGRCSKPTELIPQFLVVLGRVELPTSTLSVWRSNQLSYRTIHAEEGSVEDAQFLSIPNY